MEKKPFMKYETGKNSSLSRIRSERITSDNQQLIKTKKRSLRNHRKQREFSPIFPSFIG
jgi:hypothetical protein